MAIVKLIIQDIEDGVNITTELDEPLEKDEDATQAHFVALAMIDWFKANTQQSEQNETTEQKETE